MTPETSAHRFWGCLAIELKTQLKSSTHSPEIIPTSFFKEVFQACFLLWSASCPLGFFGGVSTIACFKIERNEPLWSSSFYHFWPISKLLFIFKVLDNTVFIPLISFMNRNRITRSVLWCSTGVNLRPSIVFHTYGVLM